MFRLAVVLHKTVEQIEQMGSRELSEWMAYSRIEPLPDAHWDAAMVAYTVASEFGGSKRRAKFADFLPRPFAAKRDAGPKTPLGAKASRGLISKLFGRGDGGQKGGGR